MVDSMGALDAVTGASSDCVRVDGSSGPCGATPPAFVDAAALTGIVDGANTAFSLSSTPNPASSLAVYRNGMLQDAGSDYTVTARSVQFVPAAAPQPGDTLLASYRVSGTAGGSGQLFPSPQVLCSGLGAATNGTTLVSIGSCVIPASLLVAGDRVEMRLNLEHQGSTAGFTFDVHWGATGVLSRDGAAADTLVTVRADAAILAAGAQMDFQSWGNSLAFAAGVAAAADSYAGGITIDFRGKVALAGEVLTLRGYTVVRLP
jgi:hypothetical protein